MSSLADIPNENKCKQMLYEITHDGLVTCGCGNRIIWKMANNYGWCKACRSKHSPKGSCWLSGTKLSCRKIFLLAFYFIHRQSPGSAISATGLSYTTIKRWYGLFREHLPVEPTNTKLSGIIEVDEAYFGKKRYSNQVIVIGAIERDTRYLKLQIIADTERESLEQFIEDNIQIGSLVVTDCNPGYIELPLLGYEHEFWNHSKGHFAGTNHIEQVWSAMKRYMRKLYGCIPTRDLKLILNEWMIRHGRPNMFNSPEELLRVIVRY